MRSFRNNKFPRLLCIFPAYPVQPMVTQDVGKNMIAACLVSSSDSNLILLLQVCRLNDTLYRTERSTWTNASTQPLASEVAHQQPLRKAVTSYFETHMEPQLLPQAQQCMHQHKLALLDLRRLQSRSAEFERLRVEQLHQ